MKVFIRIIVVILTFAFLLNCSTEKTLDFKNQTYDDLVLKAEKQLLIKEFDSANTYFNGAFSLKSKMLAFDMNNALVLTIKTKDWNQALIWSERLAKKGVSLPYFKKNSFKTFHETEQWEQFIGAFESYRSYFENHSDKEMTDSLEILMDIDQQAYCLLPSKKIDLSNVFDKTVFLDSLLSRLINNKGFPYEEKVGVIVFDDSLISPVIKFHGLYRHSYQANSNLVKSILSDAVENGDLKKALYENSLIGDNMDYALVDCKIYESKFAKQSSIENFFKEKLIFQNSSDTDFKFYAPLSIFSFDSESHSDNMMSMYSFICDYKNCKEEN
ncbi:hypothetical protein WNY78_03725 [Psychroserpens sp. AS72]|uniref:hypothetical protein n=1 Tax=Psychroserpens sp. AS72 TaxID=3135775 RepID=UPI0031732526